MNGKVCKASYEVKVGDIITIKFGDRDLVAKVLSIQETIHKEDAKDMYEIIV